MKLSSVIAVCVLGLSLVSATPNLWATRIAPTCTSHPDKGYKGHKDPIVDGDAKVNVFRPTAPKTAVTAVCGGTVYTVEVTFPEARHGLITASSATAMFASAPNATCPNRIYSTAPKDVHTANITVPCTNADVVLKVTSAKGSTDAYRQTSQTLKYNATCPCATSANATVPSPSPKPANTTVNATVPSPKPANTTVNATVPSPKPANTTANATAAKAPAANTTVARPANVTASAGPPNSLNATAPKANITASPSPRPANSSATAVSSSSVLASLALGAAALLL